MRTNQDFICSKRVEAAGILLPFQASAETSGLDDDSPGTQIREAVESEAVLVVTKILNANLMSVNWILEEAGI